MYVDIIVIHFFQAPKYVTIRLFFKS